MSDVETSSDTSQSDHALVEHDLEKSGRRRWQTSTLPVTFAQILCCLLIIFLTSTVFALSVIIAGRKQENVLEFSMCAACPETWIGFKGKCYYFSEETRNWTFSQTFCASVEASLAQFEIPEELIFLKRYKGPSDHWIGLSRESLRHTWKWTDGTENNNSDGLFCLWDGWTDAKHRATDDAEAQETSLSLPAQVDMQRSGSTNPPVKAAVSHLRRYSFSDNCNEEVFGIEHGSKYRNCTHIPPRKYQDNTNSTVNPKLNICPNDWLQKNGKCYKFFKNFESWINSQESCLVKKSHLLMIQDKAELDFIQSNRQDGIYFWIGLNIAYPPKTWTWLDGNPLNLQL